MRFGIPEYRLPRTLLREEIRKIVSLGVDLKLLTPLTPVLRPPRAQGRRLPGGLPLGRRDEGPGPRDPGRRAAGRRQGDGVPRRREPRPPAGPRPEGRHRRGRLRRVRRRADGAPPLARGRDRRPREGRDRGGQGGPRLRARGAPRRRRRADDRLARELRGDAGPEDDAGARGVRGGEKGGDPVPSAPRPEALRRRRPPRGRRAPEGPLGLRRDGALLADLRRRATSSRSRRPPASSPSASAPTSPS